MMVNILTIFILFKLDKTLKYYQEGYDWGVIMVSLYRVQSNSPLRAQITDCEKTIMYYEGWFFPTHCFQKLLHCIL